MKPFLDRLLHAVGVERKMPDRTVALRIRIAEDLQRLVLRRGREGEIAGVGQQLARLHQAVDLVLVGLLFLRHFAGLTQGLRHGIGGLPALAGMRLVDDDREGPSPLLVADLVEDEGELLDRRDDDLLALGDELSQVRRLLRMPHRGPHLRVLPDRIADLLVQDTAVGYDDDGVEDARAVPLQRDELMSQPSDRIALATAGRVLNQIPSSGAVCPGVLQEPAHHVELLIPRPDLDPLLPARLRVLRRHHLRVVLQDVGHARPGQDVAPQVFRPETARIGRVAGTVVPAAVEGQEPGRLALEVGAEVDLVLVDREVRHAAPELKEGLARVAVPLVLEDGVVDRLLREADSSARR